MLLFKNLNQFLRTGKTLFCALILVMSTMGTAWAQNLTVTGKVTSVSGEPIVGTYILIEGTRTGTSSDFNGNYSLPNVPRDARLVFSSLGYKELLVNVSGRAIINVVMEDDVTLLDEVVMIAYGSQKKEHLTGAVAVVDVEKTLDSRPITDVGRALQGSTPGLIVTTTDGSLGGTPTIKIRGYTSTMGGGDGNPLILVDNVEVPDLSYVNPEDIESISTLKDASTTAIYGARAAFGAILITTKKGSKDGKTRVSYNNNFAWGKPTNLPEFTRADLAMQYSLDQFNGLRATPVTGFGPYAGYYISEEQIRKTAEWIKTYGDGEGLGTEMVEGRDFDYNPGFGALYYRPWDVRGLFYKDWAPQQTNNINVSGGNDKTQYNISAGIMNQGGIYRQFDDFYKRTSVSGNISTQINKYLTLRAGYMYSNTSDESPMSFYSGVTDLQADIYGPTYYIYRWHTVNPYGTFNGKGFRNGLTEMQNAKALRNERYYSRYTLGATVNLIDKKLYAVFDYTYNQTFVTQHRHGGTLAAIDIFSTLKAGQTFDDMYRIYTGANANYASYDASRNLRNAYNGSIVYDEKIGENHAFKLQVGTNIEDAEYIYQRSKRMTLYDNDKGEVNLASGDQIATSSHSWWSIAGVYGRLNYNYKEKYLLDASIRYDWSSRFAAGHRLGIFPTISAAWRVTQEPWMEPLKHIVNSLKIRASYGSNGNQDVARNAYIPTITINNRTIGNYWLVNNNYVADASTPALVDPSLTWETVTTLDFGLDASFLKGKLNLTADWFQRVTSDMLTAGSTIPSSIGAAAPRQNFGELTTTGIEIGLAFNHTFNNGFHLNLSAQFFDYISKITKWSNADDPLYSDNYEGKVIGDIWGYKVDRLWQAEDFVYEDGKIKQVTLPSGKVTYVLKDYVDGYQELYESGNFKFGPGDVKFVDINGDGVINYGKNTLSDTGDRTVIGNTQPRYQYSFSIGGDWKGIDFNVFFQGVGKRHLWVTGNLVLPGYMATEANFAHTLDYWTPENTDAFYTRPFDNANGGSRWNYQVNDRYLLNMAYLRCKNITLGYTLPKRISSRALIEKLRVYLSMENLFEFDKLGSNPIDPELQHTSLTTNDARAFGRAYPYRRTVSFGVQINF